MRNGSFVDINFEQVTVLYVNFFYSCVDVLFYSFQTQ